jgi:hypothetical protein
MMENNDRRSGAALARFRRQPVERTGEQWLRLSGPASRYGIRERSAPAADFAEDENGKVGYREARRNLPHPYDSFCLREWWRPR